MWLTRLCIYGAAFCSVASLSTSCGGGSQPSPEPTPAGAPASVSASPRYDPDVITLAELEQSSLGDVDALAIIKQLRPQFMAFRGNVSGSDPSGAGTVHVMIDNGRLSGPDVLSTIRRNEILEIRYLNASTAAQRFGSVSRAGPVILIRRR
jgi:hypothetical protein